MAKKTMKPSTMMAPLPAVMVSCGEGDEANIITVAWTGIINSEPPMTYVSIRPERHSYHLIDESGEFVINLVPRELTFEMDHCGCVSGSKEDKFSAMKLTREAGDFVACPMIGESPLNLECKVVEKKELGSHDMFLAKIVAVHVDEKLFDESDKIRLEKAGLVALVHGGYYAVGGERTGRMGYSVMKPKTKKRLTREGRQPGGKKPQKRGEKDGNKEK